jgi:predicted enzyme related to lactoylglutathione lyase
VDEAAAAARSAGGVIAAEPMDVPNVGRFTVLGDPQHAYSCAWHSLQGDSEASGHPGMGTFCWNQLNTTDVDGAKAFYSKVYGWTNEAFSGGDDMRVFKAGDTAVASVMKAPEGVPAHWLSYVVVEDLAASRARVIELGGTVVVDSIDVPTVGTIAVISDNVGAMIGLFQPPAQ